MLYCPLDYSVDKNSKKSTETLDQLVFTASQLHVQQLKGQCEASTVCGRRVAAWLKSPFAVTWPRQLGEKMQLQWSGFNPHPGYVVASLDKMLYDDYLCFVASNKDKNSKEIHRNIGSLITPKQVGIPPTTK